MDAKKKLEEVTRVMNAIGSDDSKVQSSFIGFMSYVMSPGSLDAKTKNLIAISLSIAAKCDWCVSYHVNNALKAGATKDEIMEAAYIAVLMFGSPAMMEINRVLDTLEQLGK
ncbi:carboxymuconolactone decarboxylase family protein [Picrophilus oshimae]|uniref:Alkylhydroperoxidase AhpD family core domain-containing protein n=1 Tax=Picrophilus torridus (strain ATCC 700027 / DSM 9790 / JCM 10055 / NBRC 100828 / KAW 2/3) TaxID=1122961 RepID=Q6L048_PICTO|nr:carboxymuconolactone decarboxylase family protein [Picrophilus oshimae]AAT43654.1 DNA-binding protein [Picrophilus oshimae DSM 9789]SMD31279.1 alkylhydroperoxidase AhpD family core domain-containing protein [Picrophilus oshimae DSM 9789]